MNTIGIYDSGIGGLTTLCALKKRFPKCDFYYLADTRSNPLGTKKRNEIVKTVCDGLDILRCNSNLQVVACNTASTVVKPKNALLLKPDLDALPPEKTLLLCTPATQKALRLANKGYTTVNTENLATAVEITAETEFQGKTNMTFERLQTCVCDLVDIGLKNNPKINRVYLGCSHYLYFKNIIEHHYPRLQILDGNPRLIDRISTVENINCGSGNITFDFTLCDQSEKYAWIVDKLMNNPMFYSI